MDTAGDVPRGLAVTEGLAYSRKIGASETALTRFLGNLAEVAYLGGEWGEALELAEREIAGGQHCTSSSTPTSFGPSSASLAETCPARGDAEIVLRGGRAIRDPQALPRALVTAAEVAYRRDDPRAAAALLDEVGVPERVAGTWVVPAAVLAHDLGRTHPLPGGA